MIINKLLMSNALNTELYTFISGSFNNISRSFFMNNDKKFTEKSKNYEDDLTLH